ncbi:MAG: Nif3-like dinuclear metal center hexameric protein [Bacteroidia bacterium]
MKVKEIVRYLEELAPPALQESYDNCGLITGNTDAAVTGITVALDCTEDVVEDAIRNNCNMIVAHHPIVFSGLKKITGRNYIERTVIKAIRNDIAIYAIHTNLDNVETGVNARICEQLQLSGISVLSPKKNMLRKLSVYCPQTHTEQVMEAMFKAGAGNIGNYDECSFRYAGKGTFRAYDKANPFIGEKGVRHEEAEYKIEVVFPAFLESKVITEMISAHPYEEVAYDIMVMENAWQQTGSGMIGHLPKIMQPLEFLAYVKKHLNAQVIRYTPVKDKNIEKVAVCGGSGSFLLNDAIRAGADAFITGDFKYHQFFDGEGKILIADVGHFESEQFTVELLFDRLKEKFPTFAVRKTEINTNPITYYT